MKIQHIQSPSKRGFTLIELLTAVTITVSILAVLVGTTTMTMDSWKESRDRARAASQAKESLDVLARDLESAVYRSGNEHEWLYIKMDDNGDQLGPNSGEIQNPIEFGFLTAATDRYDGDIGGSNDNGGDISAVAYRLVYKDQLGGDRPVYSLYRQLTNPDQAFNTHLGQTNLDAAVDSTQVIEAQNYVAENIYNLNVTLIVEYTDSDGDVVRERLPVINGATVNEVSLTGEGLKGSGGADLITNQPDAKIVSIELGVVVLNDTAMKALSKKPFTDASFREMLKENSNYFTKTVLMARP